MLLLLLLTNGTYDSGLSAFDAVPTLLYVQSG